MVRYSCTSGPITTGHHKDKGNLIQIRLSRLVLKLRLALEQIQAKGLSETADMRPFMDQFNDGFKATSKKPSGSEVKLGKHSGMPRGKPGWPVTSIDTGNP